LKLDEEQQACNTLKVNTLSPDKSVQEFLATEKSPKGKKESRGSSGTRDALQQGFLAAYVYASVRKLHKSLSAPRFDALGVRAVVHIIRFIA
jgi:hypothetical protein